MCNKFRKYLEEIHESKKEKKDETNILLNSLLFWIDCEGIKFYFMLLDYSQLPKSEFRAKKAIDIYNHYFSQFATNPVFLLSFLTCIDTIRAIRKGRIER